VKVLEVGLDVMTHGLGGSVGVASLDRGQDASMVFVSDLGTIPAERSAPALDEQLLDGGEHDLEQRIAGGLGEGGVKVEVGLNVDVQRAARAAEEFLGEGQSFEVFGRAFLGRHSGDGRFERQTDGGEVFEAKVGALQEALIADGDGPTAGGLDAGAGAVNAADQTKAGEAMESFADDAAADAELGAEFSFGGQQVTGDHLAGENGPFEAFGDMADVISS
jgi:hypothetical protein